MVIDDLEEVAIDPNSIDEAVALNGKMEAEAASQHIRQAMPFAAISSLGLVLFGFGLARVFARAPLVESSDAALSAYIAPSMVLIGSVLFSTAAYYGVRELIRGTKAR